MVGVLIHWAYLRIRLAGLSLDMIIISGDGNCQFRSCSQQLFGCQTHHLYVRAAAVEYMREHASEFQGFFAGNQFDSYLVRMKRGRTWGDELTLRAICNCFSCHIHVVTSEQHHWYLRYAPDKGVHGRSKDSKHTEMRRKTGTVARATHQETGGNSDKSASCSTCFKSAACSTCFVD